MATITSTTSGNWSTGGTWVGGVKPADNDAVVIAAGHSVLMNDDLSAYTGLQTVTIQGSSGTPGMLYFKDGTSGYLKIRTGYNLIGTTGTNLGRLLANSDGTWGNTGSLAYANKAVIDLQGTALVNCQYLDIALHCTEPTRKYVRTYGTKYDFTASGSTIDTVNNTINLGVTPPAADTAVMITGSDLPGGLVDDYVYYVRAVSGNTCKLSTQKTDACIVDITSTGSGTCSIFTGHTGTSTATMNVLENVTADSWTAGDTAVLVDSGAPEDYDQQRITLTTINAGSIVLSANVDSVQYPGARIYLSRRNVSVRSAGVSSSQAVFDFGSATTRSGKFGCEIINTAGTGTTFYGRGIYYGTGHTISGIVAGCSSGIYFGSGHTISGIVSGCNYGINSGSGHTISGIVSGCGSGIYSGSGHTISGIVAGCSSGIYYGTGHTISGIVSGCGYGIYFGSGHTISGIVSGCGSGIYYAGFALFGTVSGNSTNIRYTGSESGPLIRGRAFKYGGLLTDTRAWSAGGKMEHETVTVPSGYSYSHKFTYENGSYWNVMEWELSGTCILCAKHDATSLATNARLHFQIIDPASDPLASASNTPLAEWIASDSTDWQYGTLAYSRTDDRLLLIRVCAMRASGVAYAMVSQNVLQSAYGF